MALEIEYDGEQYSLDLEDMEMDDVRAMERFGIKSLKDLEVGIADGELDSLTVAYWLMLKQNGQPGVRLDRVKFRPIKFVKALIKATQAEVEARRKEAAEKDEASGGNAEGA